MTTLRCLATAAAVLVVAACGGSGGGGSGSPGGTGTPPTARTARGAVTAAGGGTVTVNGVTLSTAGATIRVDDAPGGADDLRPGAVVTVRGTFDDRTGTAAEIEVEHAIEGRVDDKGTDFLVIAGQRVQVDDSTHFDDRGLDAVATGSVVRVSGVPVAGVPGAVDDKGGLRASRIDRSPRDGGASTDDHDVDVKGFVSALDAAARTFELRASPDATSWYVVDHAAISLPAGVTNGAHVEVHTRSAPIPGTPPVLARLVASAIHLEDAVRDQVEIEGYVTSGSSAGFVVAGQAVTTDAATRWTLGTPADLVPGAKVEVEGHVPTPGGPLHAEKVSFRPGVRITAAIQGYTGTSMTLLGVVIQLPSWLRNDAGPLANGLKVEVRGNPAVDGLGMVASRIDAGTSGGNADRVFLRALVSAADRAAGTLTVHGFTVSTAGASFRISGASSSADVIVTPAAFWAAVDPGRTAVKVRARSAADVDPAARTWLAEEVELELDE